MRISDWSSDVCSSDLRLKPSDLNLNEASAPQFDSRFKFGSPSSKLCVAMCGPFDSRSSADGSRNARETERPNLPPSTTSEVAPTAPENMPKLRSKTDRKSVVMGKSV